MWTDLKIEQSLKRHSKTTGGLIVMTQNQKATEKRHVTSSDRVKFTELVKGMGGLHCDSRTSHIESGRVLLSRVEKDVEKLSKHIQSFGNPFKTLGKKLNQCIYRRCSLWLNN